MIGGQWRGRRIDVLDHSGLRPTPDRIRETVFNWLTLQVAGSRVLDCFAGAGGLGLEAASREAAEVVLVELDQHAARHLQHQLDRLKAVRVSLIHDDVLHYLSHIEQGFDIVFIDPPYAQPDLRKEVLDILIERQLLHGNALVYLEWPTYEPAPILADGMEWYKQKTAGQVSYAIAQWHGTG